MFKKFPRLLKNKYFLISIVFIVWLLFFDQNNILNQYDQVEQLKLLKKEKQYYQEQIKKNQSSLDDLLTDSASLEKFARETYLMKKDSEDVFVITRDSTEKK